MNEAPPELVQAYGDWFEREGRAWHLGPPDQRISATDTAPNRASENHPDKGAYFAVKISAAGWHSAALVLVDPEKAERVKRKYTVAEHGETADSPSSRPRINLGLGGVHAFLQERGRSFLGLRARDGMQTVSGKFIWGGSPLPRLEGPDGGVVPGTGEVVGWRGARHGRDG